jgi:hypothetical protein
MEKGSWTRTDYLDGGIQSSIFVNNDTLQSRCKREYYDIGFTYDDEEEEEEEDEDDDVLNDMYDGEALQASLSSDVKASSSYHDISSSSSSSIKLLQYRSMGKKYLKVSHMKR